ncbi:hypothetical protein DRN94_002700 [archaeon]|nr:hypothetical protein [archaeon]
MREVQQKRRLRDFGERYPYPRPVLGGGVVLQGITVGIAVLFLTLLGAKVSPLATVVGATVLVGLAAILVLIRRMRFLRIAPQLLEQGWVEERLKGWRRVLERRRTLSILVINLTIFILLPLLLILLVMVFGLLGFGCWVGLLGGLVAHNIIYELWVRRWERAHRVRVWYFWVRIGRFGVVRRGLVITGKGSPIQEESEEEA